jgi:hypothetical protein
MYSVMMIVLWTEKGDGRCGCKCYAAHNGTQIVRRTACRSGDIVYHIGIHIRHIANCV